jgi:hypothetical protein
MPIMDFLLYKKQIGLRALKIDDNGLSSIACSYEL